jgi:integrase
MAIFKRGKKWVCATYVGRVDGTKCYRWATFANRVEAEACAAQQTLGGTARAPARLTVGEYLSDWIERHHVREQSTVRSRSAMRNHLIPGLGHIRLLKLRPAVIEDFIKRQTDAGYAPSTVRHNLFVLKTALNRAVKHRLLTINPLSLIDLPALGPSTAKHWDAEQVRLFLGAAKRSYLFPLFITTVAT